MTQLLATNKERQALHQQKIENVITFLKQEGYSDITNLMLLLQYKKRPPLDRLLNKLIQQGSIIKHELILMDGKIKISLWGITEFGVTQYIQSPTEHYQAFEPNRTKFSTLEHKLMNQKVRIYLNRHHWREWHNTDSYEFRENHKDLDHRPDAICTSPNGIKVAIETERTLKSPSRYRSILKSHILARKKKLWVGVYYVVPNQDIKMLLENRFDKIKYIQFDESKHPFEKYRKDLVLIFTLDEIKNINKII
ncbi:MobC family replication-relaxation protein [uncultured Vibrio sp.]|uniref:MobC family replication-relaxation protein n=2 Tax=uncultured Vibrio sp. TaxID=114054 RepID=UPI002627F5FC|nr:MobC family replication-relaxation protein [uncultured Vibrio sp.]